MKSTALICILCLALTAPSFAIGEHDEIPSVREYSGRLAAKPKPQITFRSPEVHTEFIEQLRTDSVKVLERLNLFVVPGDEAKRQELMATGRFEYVEHDWLLAPAEMPNDPLVADQWYIEHLGAPTVWAETTVQESFPIAICDSGIELDHPDLAPHLIPGYNSADEIPQSEGGDVSAVYGHGTRVAGPPCAVGNNDEGITGLMWTTKLMPIRVTNREDGYAYLTDIADGIRWAVDHGARVCVASFGGGHTAVADDAGEDANELGAWCIWAAGNYGNIVNTAREHTIVVGATNSNDQLMSWSNRGPGIDLVAPGHIIMTTYGEDEYRAPSGTSYSCPIVGGILAAFWAKHPDFDAQQIERALYSTVVDLGAPDLFGHGRVDFAAATTACFEDTDDDGVVGMLDVVNVLESWGAEGGDADVDFNQVVNLMDLLAVLDAWGTVE